MQLTDFHYNLPDELIANTPHPVRGSSRLLRLDKLTGEISDTLYAALPELLNAGDLLVINDTKVIKARLIARKSTGATRELVLVEKHGKTDDWHRHRVVYRGRLKTGDELWIQEYKLFVEQVIGDGIALIRSEKDLLEVADEYGSVPLPPYMRRDATDADTERYQTIWAREQGSVAAPTASLNMTEDILQSLKVKGVKIVYATLHVGLGTFLPIRVEDVTKHKMHKEYFEVPSETVEAIQSTKASGGRVVALGTTITRTLEYCHNEILSKPPTDLRGEADIFMYPGYQFKVIDGLLTNFHATESTVLMLTAAFAGWDKLKPAYEHAVKQHYKFFSYGDSMIIL